MLNSPRLVYLIALLCLNSIWSRSLIAQPTKPNILIIVGDDMGYADVGFHGCKDIPTPNLDALAAGGARFTNGYVSGPYCSPTRAGLLTGRYQQRFGHEFNPAGDEAGLPVGQSTLADRLRAVGYRTALVGKWHLGSKPNMHPQKRGFDEFFGFLGGAHSYFETKGVQRNGVGITELDYTTDAFGREAVSFIDRNQDNPWFLYLAFNAVHTPMDATPKYLDRFKHIEDKKRRTYCAMMSAMDDAIGQVINRLKSNNQLDNTIIAFFSDNGGPTMNGTTTNGSVNNPLRGSKRTTLEGGIRVPFVISWPRMIKPRELETPVIQLDIHTTALTAAGVEIQPEWKLDGVDLLPYVNGQKNSSPHDALYWRFGKQIAIREGNWKLVAYDSNADTNTGKRQPVTSERLYNLAEDIREEVDQSTKHPDIAKRLKDRWNAWNQANINPLWGGGNAAE